MPQMSQVLREHAIFMLSAAISPGAVISELNVHFSVCNKALLWGKMYSDWLGLAPQWVMPNHGCAPAQSCEILRLGQNLFI